jgi:hypothetical protein
MGPTPSGRSDHAMVSNGKRLFVLGGTLELFTPADKTEVIHVLETSMYFLSFHRTTSEFENRTHRDSETRQCCQA